MNHSELIEKLLRELSYRVGIPNIYNKEHQSIMSEILTEWNEIDAKYTIMNFLNEEGENKNDDRYVSKGFGRFKLKGKEGEDDPTYEKDDKGNYVKLDKKDGETTKDEKPKKTLAQDVDYQRNVVDKEKETRREMNPELEQEEKSKTTAEKTRENRKRNRRYLENTKGITSTQNINGIDGKNKENVLNAKEKVPGSPSSAVAEVAVGYGMSCLSENDFDVKRADECLRNKLNETKLGKQYNKEEVRRGALQGARRELIKVGKLIEEEGLNPKTTITGHVGGSKES